MRPSQQITSSLSMTQLTSPAIFGVTAPARAQVKVITGDIEQIYGPGVDFISAVRLARHGPASSSFKNCPQRDRAFHFHLNRTPGDAPQASPGCLLWVPTPRTFFAREAMLASCARSEPLFVTSCAMIR